MAGKLGETLSDVGSELSSQTERFAENFAEQLARAQSSQEQAVEILERKREALKNQVDQIGSSVENHKSTIESLIEGALEQMRDGQETIIDSELQLFADKLGAIAAV